MYLYHASGLGAGGYFTSPFADDIAPQAACCLPMTGGRSVCRVGNFSYAGKVNAKISFSAAHVEVSGNGSGAGSATSVVSIVENLNIMDIVTADRVVAHIDSTHNLSNTDPEPEFLTNKSDLVNLKINGQPVTVEFAHDTFAKFNTYKKFQDGFASSQADVLNCMMGREVVTVANAPQNLHDAQAAFANQRSAKSLAKIIQCSLIKSVAGPGISGIKAWGPVIVIPNFGVVYLGEVIVAQGMRRLNMLRVEMGSPITGSFAVSGGDSNGTSFPPPP